MGARLLVLTAASLFGLMLAVTPTTASAKQNYVSGATLSGGSLASAVYIPLPMQDNYDEMYELRSAAVAPDSLAYDIVLHYDFSEDGYGLRDWAGKFDGDTTLYFPESMLVGSGIWAAGWYAAGDLLASPLHETIASPSLPAAGGARPRPTRPWGLLSAALALLGVAAILGSRVRASQS